MRNSRAIVRLSLATVALCGTAGISTAQEASKAGTEELKEVLITGSRIARRDFEANTPIVTVASDDIKQTGEVSVEMALQQLPQFMPDMNANTPLLSNGGRAQVNLRGLGANRTLVLLDGRRMQSSDPTGVTDLNTIPSTMIESVEIISGGASAVYGSDAISGVINFKTRDSFQGVEVDAQWGQTTKSDAGQQQYAITMGSNFNDNKGNAVISVNFMRRDLIRENTRPFFANANPQAVLPTGSYTVDAANLPTQAAINTYFAQFGVPNGTVLNTRNLGFNDYDNSRVTLFPLTGTIVNYTGPGRPYIIQTPTSLTSAAGQYISLVQPIDRYGVYGKMHYDVTDRVRAYSQFYLTQNDVATTAGPTTLTASIAVNNPFVPNDLKPILASRPNPNAPFTLSKIAGEFGMRAFSYRYTTYQILAGFKGDFDMFGSRWNWDVFGAYGTTSEVFATSSSTDQNVVNTLTLAADGGASTGCAYDPFHYNNAITTTGALSAACQKLLSRYPKDETNLSQREYMGALGGPVFKLPAGDVQISATAGFRGYGFLFRPDALGFAQLPTGGTNFAVYTNASDSTREASLEVLIPLLKDRPWARLLNIDLAGRYSDYLSTGGTATYKADMEWSPLSALRFRGGYEHALRAPNPAELYGAATTVQTTLGSPPTAGDPCDVRSSLASGPDAAKLRALCVALGVPASLANSYQFTRTTTGGQSVGNPDVKPETANTYTFGAVWSQDFGRVGLRTSVDWYSIEVSKAIGTIPLQTILNKCYNIDGSNPGYSATNFYCTLQQRNTFDGTLNNIRLSNQNIGGFSTKGVDLQTDLRIPLPRGTLSFNATLNYVYNWEVQLLPDSPWQNVNGEVVPTVSTLSPLTPKWRGLLKPSYQIGSFRIGARIQYIDSMVDPTYFANPATALAGVPSYIYYGLDANYRIGRTFNLRVGIDNIADKQPPIVRATAGVTSPTTYDTVGRRYFIGGSASF